MSVIQWHSFNREINLVSLANLDHQCIEFSVLKVKSLHQYAYFVHNHVGLVMSND